jgi:hypothetical protein
MALGADPEYDVNNSSTAPRKIWFGSRSGTAECALTTTYVEMNHTCSVGHCSLTAFRRSRLKHKSATTTWLNGGPVGDDRGPPESLGPFCSGFVRTTEPGSLAL